MKTKLINIVVTTLLLATVFSSYTYAKDKPKEHTSIESFRNEAEGHPIFALAVSLASLSSHKVILQQICHNPPAVGGFETVLEQSGTRYTCWLWKDPETKRNHFRVYYYPIGKKEKLKTFTDWDIDNVVNYGFAENNPDFGDILQLSSSANHNPVFSDITCLPKGVDDSQLSRQLVLDAWAEEYFKVVSDLRAYVALANHKTVDGMLKTHTYDEINRLVCTIYQNDPTLWMEEWKYDASNNIIRHTTRVLKQQ